MSDSKKNKSKGCVMSQKLRLSGESLRGLRLLALSYRVNCLRLNRS